MRRGFAPPEPQKGLFNVLEEVDEITWHVCQATPSLMRCSLGSAVARKAYEAEQARIAGIPVTPAPGIALPLPGVAFVPEIPTVWLGIMHRQGRGDPPLSITSMLPWPLGHSTLLREEWYESCSIVEPEFLALIEKAKKLPPGSRRREQHSVLRQVKAITEKAKKTAYFVIPDTMPPDITVVLKKWEHNPEGVPMAIQQ